MRFENPLVIIYVIWSLPLLPLFWFFTMRRKAKIAQRFIENPLLGQMAASLNVRRQYLKAVLTSLALVLILFALSRP